MEARPRRRACRGQRFHIAANAAQFLLRGDVDGDEVEHVAGTPAGLAHDLPIARRLVSANSETASGISWENCSAASTMSRRLFATLPLPARLSAIAPEARRVLQHDGEAEILLAREVLEQRALGAPGLAGDLLRGEAREALCLDQTLRGIEDQLTRGAGVHCSPGCVVRSECSLHYQVERSRYEFKCDGLDCIRVEQSGAVRRRPRRTGGNSGPGAVPPAWRETGVVAWADFTRAADLGAGRIVYPAIGLTALLLAVAAAFAYRFDRTLPRAGAAPTYAAAVLAIAALIVTGRLLARVTLSLVHMPDDPAQLGPLFDSVVQWWDVKALLHTLAFVAISPCTCQVVARF